MAVITLTVFAKTKCKKLRSEYEFFNALNEYLKSVKSAAGYKKAKISEISVDNADFKEFLGNFPLTGKLSDLTAHDYLTEAEKLKISTLFSLIVSADAKSLNDALNSYISEFGEIIDEKRANLIKRKPVYLKVGFAVWLMLFIMVI